MDAIESAKDAMYYVNLAMKQVEKAEEKIKREARELQAKRSRQRLTQQEAASLLDVSRMTIHRWLKSEKLKSLHVDDVLDLREERQ